MDTLFRYEHAGYTPFSLKFHLFVLKIRVPKGDLIVATKIMHRVSGDKDHAPGQSVRKTPDSFGEARRLCSRDTDGLTR